MVRMLAGASLGCGIVGLPLWLLSYAWLPFAWTGREEGFVRYVVVAGEVGAVAAGILGVVLGVVARRSSGPHEPDYRCASRGLVVGGVVLGLVLIPNIVGILLASR